MDATLLIFESPRRIARLLTEMAESFGPDRQAVICREITKRFEEALRGSLTELAAILDERQLKGEIVLVVDRAGEQQVDEADLEEALRAALGEMPVKQAAAEIAARFGARKRDVYQLALSLKDDK